MDRQNAFREQEMNMGIKVKKILTGHGQQPLYALNGHQSHGQNDRLESRLSLIRQYREYFQEALLRP